jgi:hypothetical protein
MNIIKAAIYEQLNINMMNIEYTFFLATHDEYTCLPSASEFSLPFRFSKGPALVHLPRILRLGQGEVRK